MSRTQIDNINQIHQRENPATVLIVDDDADTARLLLELLARRGIHANLADDVKTALDFLDKSQCDLIFLSENLSSQPHSQNRPADGFELLRKIRANSPELPVIVMGQFPNSQEQIQSSQSRPEQHHQQLRRLAEVAVNALHAGCRDFLLKPLDREQIESLLDTILPNHVVCTAASAQQGSQNLYHIVGKSPKLIQTIQLAEKIAPTSFPVLVGGESGTGKELISYLIHHKSNRSLGPYIKVNCAALSESLLESELFGHEKGAFTGAYTQRKGRFEMAHGGTLLLDEITETPSRFQAKLLRILEQQEFERVGGNVNITVDVRIISTTNKDILQEVRLGRFRQDLYYRLSTARIVLAPLRERIQDLPELVWHFLNLYSRQIQRRITKLDPSMIDIFLKYHWPGNVRQLRNVVLTSLILGVGTTLSLADVSWLFDELQPLPQHCTADRTTNTTHPQDYNDQLATQTLGLGGIPLVQLERQAILDTLRQTAGNQTKAAKVLGISDRTLREKIRRYRQRQVLQPVS